MFKKIIQWFLYSSKDPAKFALTLKGAIPFLVLLNIGDVEALGTVFDSVANLLVLTGTWATGAMTFYGAARKVYLSLPFIHR